MKQRCPNADVTQRGTSSWHEDQLVPIWRDGRLDEAYWTYSYSPVYDDAGEVFRGQHTRAIVNAERLETGAARRLRR
mgnify:CR=1 FL=1